MTGADLIRYIEANQLQDRPLFLTDDAQAEELEPNHFFEAVPTSGPYDAPFNDLRNLTPAERAKVDQATIVTCIAVEA